MVKVILLNSVWFDGDGDDQEMRTIGRSWDEYHGDMCKPGLDAKLKEPDLYCFCTFITIQQQGFSNSTSYRTIACLLLECVREEIRKVVCIGMLVLEDLYALKRYRLHADLEEDS